jgi:diguanylate cyclase (GGDEF)-like protein
VPFIGRDSVMRITASLGVASIPDSAADLPALVAVADAALYAAKRGGKNRVVLAPNLGAPTDGKGRAPARRS